jgi:hypothetical protein
VADYCSRQGEGQNGAALPELANAIRLVLGSVLGAHHSWWTYNRQMKPRRREADRINTKCCNRSLTRTLPAVNAAEFGIKITN